MIVNTTLIGNTTFDLSRHYSTTAMLFFLFIAMCLPIPAAKKVGCNSMEQEKFVASLVDTILHLSDLDGIYEKI